jgi:hypothetical protein
MVFQFLPITSVLDRFEKELLSLRFPCTVVHGINSSLVRTHTVVGEGVVLCSGLPRGDVRVEKNEKKIYSSVFISVPQRVYHLNVFLLKVLLCQHRFQLKTKRGTAATIITPKADEKKHYSINGSRRLLVFRNTMKQEKSAFVCV